MKLSDIILKYRTEHGISQRQMGAQCNLSTGYISLIEKEINPQTGKKMVPTIAVMNKLASGMGMKLDALLSVCDDMDVTLSGRDGDLPPNILPLPKMEKVPLLGTIACGEPILAEENIDGFLAMPENVGADFCLRCKGDSMINARIFDGDIVYIRQQPAVENGEIAAVMVGDDEATLKRVRIYDDCIALEPENPQYRPQVFRGAEMDSVHILGKAISFTSDVR